MNETILLAQITTDFYLDGKRYAQRQSLYVPCVGDEVRFHDVVYEIVHKIWIYDEERPRVAMTMEQVQD